MRAHEMLGHASEDTTRNTAKHLGWKLTGKWNPCESCLIGKAKQKNVPKITEDPTKNPGEKLYYNISSVNVKSLGVRNSGYWWLIQLQNTNGVISYKRSQI